MRQMAGILALLILTAAPLRAEAPESSVRPEPRPGTLPEAASVLTVSALAPDAALRPRPRPTNTGTSPPAPAAAMTVAAAARTLPASFGRVRPMPRPQTLPPAATNSEEATVQTAAAVRILPGKSAVVGRKGSVCGVNGIKGEVLAPITSRVKGCGIKDPVLVTSVDGVQLSMAATLDCPTARALHDWVRGALKPAFGRTSVMSLQVAAHYACRPRNNVQGAPISEHGRGKAIDISAIVLKNGKTVSVLDDWRNKAGRPMVKAYRAACGTFGTTLGPDSDRFHRNHLHFDTARHRNGPYCR